ncbi:aspartate carbamoyltransferase catalytic subunit [Ignavigranum ruoffiae]|uniref:Aspartate carbamoyltransferase n=1 Tax=Ignavigranum ruoffiae TaxID=89093 RepID=A0A1H9F0X1_9LACT|nr:aspartate carbamoyltransferase catalytic subunit [Ignavigranum ruoffiae]SEQ31545.1 aspartate carbamoyltransferase [Ignavigranum ruoffiae]
MMNLLSMDHLSKEEMMALIDRAIAIKEGNIAPFDKTLYVSNLFFENSTRTKKSFEMAQAKLGIHTIDFEVSTSSVNKGESLYDTCKTMEAIGCDALVIRHPENEYYQQLEGLNIPVINGGDGSGSHPSQCLLDLMTIYEKFGYFEGLKVIIVGDILHSRVAKSNFQALTKLGADVKFVAPQEYREHDLPVEYVDMDQVIDQVDVCMLLRVQLERHLYNHDDIQAEYNKHYGLNMERYLRLKDQAIIMHPAPVNRGVEITDELVEADKSVIFEQMTNGVYMRMSILQTVLSQHLVNTPTIQVVAG